MDAKKRHSVSKPSVKDVNMQDIVISANGQTLVRGSVDKTIKV